MTHSSRRKKPAKPYPDFPLFAHATGRWVKKIRGKLHYFGPWNDPQSALQRYLDQRDALHAGRQPHQRQEGLPLADLCSRFLDAKLRQVERGTLGRVRWFQLRRVCKWIVDTAGRDRPVEDLGPEDFARLRQTMTASTPGSQNHRITAVRSVFNFGVRQKLIKELPVYGDDFELTPRKEMRRCKNGSGPLMFEATDIRHLMEAASPRLRASILLGVNCGFGQADISSLTTDAIKGEWCVHPRPKTGVARRCWLWPETREALAVVLANRPESRKSEHKNLVFIAKAGVPLVRLEGQAQIDLIGNAFNHLLRQLGMKRQGLSFYALRRTFATVGEETLDFAAVQHVMGHVPDSSMTGVYRQHISDDRLQRVADHVRKWLFGEGDDG